MENRPYNKPEMMAKESNPKKDSKDAMMFVVKLAGLMCP